MVVRVSDTITLDWEGEEDYRTVVLTCHECLRYDGKDGLNASEGCERYTYQCTSCAVRFNTNSIDPVDYKYIESTGTGAVYSIAELRDVIDPGPDEFLAVTCGVMEQQGVAAVRQHDVPARESAFWSKTNGVSIVQYETLSQVLEFIFRESPIGTTATDRRGL